MVLEPGFLRSSYFDSGLLLTVDRCGSAHDVGDWRRKEEKVCLCGSVGYLSVP